MWIRSQAASDNTAKFSSSLLLNIDKKTRFYTNDYFSVLTYLLNCSVQMFDNFFRLNILNSVLIAQARFKCLFYVRPSDFLQSIRVRHVLDALIMTVVGLCSELLMRLSYYIHLGFVKKLSSHVGIKPGSLRLRVVYSTPRQER